MSQDYGCDDLSQRDDGPSVAGVAPELGQAARVRRRPLRAPAAESLPELRGVHAIRLPGELDVDRDMVTQAVGHLNRIYARSTLEVALEVGTYVLNAFFDGDPAAFRKRGRGHATFTALADRDELQFNRVWLWRAVSVVDQLQLLPPEAAEALPFTHHTALLPVRDQTLKANLAQRAAAEGWSKRRLQEEVSIATEGGPTRGRPRLPRLQRQLNQLTRLAGKLKGGDPLDDPTRADLLTSLDAVMGQLQDLRHQLSSPDIIEAK